MKTFAFGVVPGVARPGPAASVGVARVEFGPASSFSGAVCGRGQGARPTQLRLRSQVSECGSGEEPQSSSIGDGARLHNERRSFDARRAGPRLQSSFVLGVL